MVPDAHRHVSQVGGKPDLDSLGTKCEADRVGGVVRDGKWRHLDVTHTKAAASRKMLGPWQFRDLPFLVAHSAVPSVMRAFSYEYWHFQFGCQTVESSNVIGMLVGNEDGRDSVGAFVQGVKALEGFAAGETGIDQNAGRTARHQCAVPTTAAGQQ